MSFAFPSFSPGSVRGWLPAFGTALCLSALVPDVGIALPPGRAWAPTVDLAHSGTTFLGTPRLEVDSGGVPFFIAETDWSGGPRAVWGVFAWQDSAWSNRGPSGVPGRWLPEPVLSLTPRRFIVWVGAEDPFGYSRLLMSELLPDRVATPDTAMVTTDQDSEYSGAASDLRRWGVRSQQRFPAGITWAIRTVYADTPGVWRELPELGMDEYTCTMAPISDTGAIVVYAGQSGLGWAIAEGSSWTTLGNLDPRPWQAAHPRFRFRPSGGLWLLWTERSRVHISSYREGLWSRGDSLTCAHPDGGTYWSAWCDASRDTAERPVLAWGDLGVGTTYRDVGCVAFPTDSGWAQGEEIPGSENLFTTPYITRDRNGDVWAAWRILRETYNRWTHTYVTAITDTPRLVADAQGRPGLSWSLSAPAPESWWAVLRAPGEGEFESVARLQADAKTAMNWTDASPPSGPLRYRIRRESVDARYRWESGEANWPLDVPPGPGGSDPLRLVRLSAHPFASGARFEILNAREGPLIMRVYDLRGRLVLHLQALAGGSGRDTIEVDLGSASPRLGAGLYLLRVVDAADRLSPSAKLVLLR
jgi:hypothetical protein